MALTCPNCGNDREFLVKTAQVHVVQVHDGRVNVAEETRPSVFEVLCDQCDTELDLDACDEAVRKELAADNRRGLIASSGRLLVRFCLLEIVALRADPFPRGARHHLRGSRDRGNRFSLVVSGGHKWLDISTGTDQTCGITVAGRAYCWGKNRFGGPGTGDTTSSLIPRAVASTDRFVAINIGSVSACALTIAGQVRCWGLDAVPLFAASSGGFGNSLVPIPPPGNPPALASLSMGLAHACGTTPSGAGYCWGRNRQGSLGDGAPLSFSATFSYAFSRVIGTLTFSQMGTGFHTCALTTAGDAHCWGRNLRGELGNGNRVVISVPSRVAFEPHCPGDAGEGHPRQHDRVRLGSDVSMAIKTKVGLSELQKILSRYR